MVIVKSSTCAKKKWLRGYRICFVVGIAILTVQFLLAIHFVSISKAGLQVDGNEWQPQNSPSDDTDGGGNSAGRVRSEDDEDVQIISQKSRKYKTASSNVSHLRIDELDFVPLCHISGKEAVSAIHRAKTQKCKHLISNITCLAQSGQLYPNELIGSCPTGSFKYGKQLGCFKDEKVYRLLSGYYGVNKKLNSPKYCINLCLQSGFPFAGVQYSNECFCGNDEPPSTSKLPDSRCNMKCPGDGHASCGGYYTMSVFHTGIKRFVAQVANTEPVENSETAKIVFLLTINGRAVRQVLRLLKILYHKDHYYYIHVDIRQDYLFRQLLFLEKRFSNVKLTRKRFATIWGGASLLEMLLSCMQELLEIQDWEWDFVLNLSESDFPVKTVAQLTNFLSANRDRNFVKSHGREVQRFIQKQGLDKTFVECETRMWRVGDRHLPDGVQLDGGSDWVALSRSFVEYVASDNPDELLKGLKTVFKHTLLPAESFFHTVLRNSKFCTTYVDNNLHVTNWKRKLGCKCQYKHIVDWCGCSPNDFRPDDWSRIQNTLSRQLYFARKFEPIINQAVILQLELWLFGLEQPSNKKKSLHNYWQNIYHFQDLGQTYDDGLYNLAESIKRRVVKTISKSKCKMNEGVVQQITSHHYKDAYKSTLFTLHLRNTNSSSVSIEVATVPVDKRLLIKQSPLFEYLEHIEVSSDYDQKEQISRNFLKILSPYSDVVLIYRFSSLSRSYNVSSLWIDPTDRLVEVSEIYLDENSLIGHVKPSLKQPVLPGKWTMKLVYKNTLVDEVTFLIIPLQYLSGKALSETQVNFYNGGSLPEKDFSNSDFDVTKTSTLTHDIKEKLSLENSKKIGKDLEDWIDSLTEKFYLIEKMCAIVSEGTVELCGTILKACVKSDWSSFSPDPKSAIDTVNETTGTFNIW